jgi:hypothetical protein
LVEQPCSIPPSATPPKQSRAEELSPARSLLPMPTRPSNSALPGSSPAVVTPCSQVRSMRWPCSWWLLVPVEKERGKERLLSTPHTLCGCHSEEKELPAVTHNGRLHLCACRRGALLYRDLVTGSWSCFFPHQGLKALATHWKCLESAREYWPLGLLIHLL